MKQEKQMKNQVKKKYKCTECNSDYWAKWSKGLCPTCRDKRNGKTYNEKHYKSADPYSHRVNATTEGNNDWIPPVSPGLISTGPHPVRNREAVEAKNNLVRRYYEQIQRECNRYGTNFDDWR